MSSLGHEDKTSSQKWKRFEWLRIGGILVKRSDDKKLSEPLSGVKSAAVL